MLQFRYLCTWRSHNLVSLLPVFGRLDCLALPFEAPEEFGDVLWPLDVAFVAVGPQIACTALEDLVMQEASDGVYLIE